MRFKLESLNIIVAIVLFHFTSCDSKSSKPDRVIQLNCYGLEYVESLGSLAERITHSDTVYLEKELKNDTLNFTYRFTDKSTALSFAKSIKSDSSIYIYGHDSKLTGVKIYRIENVDYPICRYYYDEQSVADEESSYFYHCDYGILVTYNNGWNDLVYSIFYDATSKMLVDSIINDRRFLRYVPSLPIPHPEVLED